MIHRVFVLNDKTAGEIMTPIDHVKAIGASYTIKQAAAAVGNCRFSRYPIFGETVDDVKGIALIREVLRSAQDRPRGIGYGNCETAICGGRQNEG